jgi:O-acetyl-ADP-ribose deacetylase (regulator of RNase III)
VNIINGDLLEIESGIILHQVNSVGATGGLAGALRRKYPTAFVDYIMRCREHDARAIAGSVTICMAAEPALYIAHLFGQISPGPNTDLGLVESALQDEELRMFCREHQPYAPYQMGCGLGGGNWDDYSALLEKHIPDIIIVRKY